MDAREDALTGTSDLSQHGLSDEALEALSVPFVQDLIAENEAMLIEITILRDMRRGYQQIQQECLLAEEGAARQELAMREADERAQCGGGFLHDILHELCGEVSALREENSALQGIMLTVQAELGGEEDSRKSVNSVSPHTPVNDPEERTPLRCGVSSELGNKLLVRYSAYLGDKGTGARVASRCDGSLTRGCKRTRMSDGDFF
uniref:Uncharacterized protein TCIL3000_11_13860 n=1 Tax=Trypanosoma congolense (strain IL3000) TaxID=1068625 RepID=G0V2K8_TRYCI|nr:unnamed protein product [Trypanosoma congolense IL3000]